MMSNLLQLITWQRAVSERIINFWCIFWTPYTQVAYRNGMDRPSDELAQLTQAVHDLEALVREELVALQYEVMGTRDALSEELATHIDSLKRQIRMQRRG